MQDSYWGQSGLEVRWDSLGLDKEQGSMKRRVFYSLTDSYNLLKSARISEQEIPAPPTAPSTCFPIWLLTSSWKSKTTASRTRSRISMNVTFFVASSKNTPCFRCS